MTRLSGTFFTDDAIDKPYWWDAAEPEGTPPDDLPAQIEVAIIGGGFTGLNAALVLAKAGKQVAVFDAEAPGWGASSRNGGILGPGYAFLDAGLAYGPDVARRILEESLASLQYVKDVVAAEQINCDLAVVGYFKGAMTPRIYDSLGRYIDRVRRALPCDAYLVPKAEQRHEIGTDLYHGGMVIPGYAGIHPAKYVRGLAQATQRAGAAVYGHARVTDLRAEGGEFTFKVGRRDIRAKQVLLATNGYQDGLSPLLKRRIMPVGSGLIATEPLEPALMNRLMPKQRMLAGSQRVVRYYRPSPDGTRIIFGGRVLNMNGEPSVSVASAAYVRSLLLQVFPELAETRISHYWHGTLGFTFDHLPHVGAVDGVFFAAGYNGTGVARASWLGSRIAHQMLGSDLGRTVYGDLKFNTRPYFYGKSWFLPAAVTYYDIRDRWDER
jgi:glycine/D-amino acid oxidase-like deaminating enzyme